ncbi:hypothetical protein [Algivirga pacifica]|uniref:DUF4279 domain-containing protein n=1 Tax=Algivirga pacifica TaxID=1162670 RepID=A0ABP9DHX0_9BACT
MSCILRIEGVNFKVDQFLEVTLLEPYKVWHSGELVTPKRKHESLYTTSGCNIDISAADFDEFHIQKSDAIKFMIDNYDKLLKLPKFGLLESESATLDFGIYTRMFDVGRQTDRFEPELLKLAGNLNLTIALSQYEPATREENK